MPAKKKVAPVALTAAAAERMISQAITLLAAELPPVPPEAIKSAGIPITGGKSMVDAQRFRVNWYELDRKQLNRIARLMCERNWFAAPVHALRKKMYGGGFRLATQEARDWAASGTYPFKRIHDDLLHEYLVNDAAFCFWRTDVASDSLPMIEIPDIENVDYQVIGGVPTAWIKVERNGKIADSLKDVLGLKLWEAIKSGKPLVLVKGDTTSGYDFAMLKAGKSTALISPPSLTGILDDLDFIEAARVGDWNGAWSRREIIRQTKKGYGVSSGPNAGTVRNNAKYAELQNILKAMKAIVGKTDVATNFDQEIDWKVFPSDFFNSEQITAAKERLIFWGGLAAVMLLKTDSQITGLAAFLYDRIRVEVESFREDFGPFLAGVFNSETFIKNFPGAPLLTVAWGVKSLYTGAALQAESTFLSTYGLAAPQTLRERYGIDDVAESARMLAAQANRDAYTPVYEPRQGLLPMQFPQEYNVAPAGDVPPPVVPPGKKTAAPAPGDPPPKKLAAKKAVAKKMAGTPGRPPKV